MITIARVVPIRDMIPPFIPRAAAALGGSLPIRDASRPDTVAEAVQLLPHAYPVGQQPPPSSAAQLDQPVAHAPVKIEFAERPSDVVATIVTLLLSIRVVVSLVGQEVGAQSLPNRQQPPW